MDDERTAKSRTTKELRREIGSMVAEAVTRMQPSARETQVEVSRAAAVSDDGVVARVAVRDLELGEPAKGERPWHVYRVIVSEEYGAVPGQS